MFLCVFFLLLGLSSGFHNLPDWSSSQNQSQGDAKMIQDGRLPFYKFDLHTTTWTRLASLPESLASSAIKLCMCDKMEAMATCI